MKNGGFSEQEHGVARRAFLRLFGVFGFGGSTGLVLSGKAGESGLLREGRKPRRVVSGDSVKYFYESGQLLRHEIYASGRLSEVTEFQWDAMGRLTSSTSTSYRRVS